MNPQQQQPRSDDDETEGALNNTELQNRTNRYRRFVLITSFFAFYLTAALLANEHDEPTSNDGVPILPSSSPIPRIVCN